MWLLLYAAVPAILALVFWRAERGAADRKKAALARVLEEGAEAVELRVRAEGAGPTVRLGSSVESPESISATPTLTAADDVILVEAPAEEGAPPTGARAGRRLRLRAGVSIDVETLPGARRTPLEIETTASGIQHRYSFEIPPDKPFWITGSLTRPDAGGPFREGATWELSALRGDPGKGHCIASANPGVLLRRIDGPNLGLGGALVFGAIGLGLSFVPHAGPVLWGIVALLLAVATLGEWGAARAVATPATPGPDAPPRVRIAAPPDAPRGGTVEAEEEDSATEPAAPSRAARPRE